MEYPVVFVPFATRHKDPLKFGNRNVSFIEYHDENGVLQHSLDGSVAARATMAEEAYAEAIRLLYVAVTRAEKRCYILSTGFEHFEKSPLGKTLKWTADSDIATSLQQLIQDNPNEIALTVLDNYLSDESTDNQLDHQLASQHENKIGSDLASTEKPQPAVARFNGKIERDWWLSSFSALSKNLRHNGVSAPDRDNQDGVLAVGDNELESSLNPHLNNPSNINSHELRFTLTKGAQTGNLLHDILEQTDFSAPDWQKSCHWPLVKYGVIDATADTVKQVNDDAKGVSALSSQEHSEARLIQWLEAILHTPLTDSRDLSLAQLKPLDTLRETEFYYPMRSASSSQLTKLLTEHRNTRKDNALNSVSSSRHGHRVHLPSYQQLKGMMHGFIDLIFHADGKYYVCDYKSSHLGDQYSDYNDSAMRHNIEKSHYDLQYLIYALALHRHLKYALADYDPKQHFGGIYYLYLRGMSNQAEHHGCGVYYRQITLAELAQLDDIFAGESTHV
tara:strand:- start:306 stop:1817 length:1512 start_codon:yes stop_codon:yes gene_type:complete